MSQAVQLVKGARAGDKYTTKETDVWSFGQFRQIQTGGSRGATPRQSAPISFMLSIRIGAQDALAKYLWAPWEAHQRCLVQHQATCVCTTSQNHAGWYTHRRARCRQQRIIHSTDTRVRMDRQRAQHAQNTSTRTF